MMNVRRKIPAIIYVRIFPGDRKAGIDVLFLYTGRLAANRKASRMETM